MKGNSGNQTKKIEILDTTLRERTFGISFAVGEKLSIASMLDSLGVAFVESSLPRKNPKEIEYLKGLGAALKRGSDPVLYLPAEYFLDKEKKGAEEQEIPHNIRRTSFKISCWQSHLTEAYSFMKITPEENIKRIKSRVLTLRQSGKDVFFYAEHFFDGFFEDTAYALTAVETAVEAGASRVALIDSRGTALPEQVSKAVKLVASHLSSRPDVILGMHAHNDLGLAVANTLAAIESGAKHVQGSVNGLGERTGDADLCQLLPILILKLGFDALNSPHPRDQQLISLKALSRRVSDISGITLPQQPFVSDKAFAHSEPTHVADVSHDPETYEGINPALVGNSRRLGVDDASLILTEMWELGLYTKDKEEIAAKVLVKMREMESQGYKFDDAKASVHLLVLDTLGVAIWPFKVLKWETSTVRTMNDLPEVSGTIWISLGEDGKKKTVATAKGVGPIHAIDLALKKALEGEFPELKDLKLVSYALNIVDSLNGTAAAARARTEFEDQDTVSNTWATTSVSDDVVDASIKSLIDGYRYKLIFRSRNSKFTLPDWKVALSWRYSERC
ncbi:MAG: alpha-isopropylmalate synthase regulatory domain-containing protein [Nitrososphaerales archaeon]